MTADANDLEIRNIVKRFGDFTAVDDVSFTVPKGSFFSILGPSGCGKTTIMRMIAGFQEPDSGDILIKGRPVVGVPPNRRPVNKVFQHLALFPMMTVEENIAYGLRRRRVAKSEIKRRVGEMLERVGLPDAGAKRVDQLSGGQKQRIAIARCLVLEPDLLLLDEPLGALDLKLREHMKVELKQLQSEVGTSFVYITHDQSEALVMSDRIAVMNGGRFEQVGTPQQLYYEPETAFVAGFVGDANRWSATVLGRDGREVRLRLDGGTEVTATTPAGDRTGEGGRLELFVRPEAVRVASGGDAADQSGRANRISGTVRDLLFNGANSQILITEKGSGVEVVAALPQTGELAGLDRGAPVHLTFSVDQARAFPVAGMSDLTTDAARGAA